MKKRIAIIIIVLVVALQSAIIATASSMPAAQQVKTLQAVKENVAARFDALCIQNEKWEGTNLVFDRALFDAKDHISAYMFSIKKDGIAAGYLIANTLPENNIIEYGDECFLNEAMGPDTIVVHLKM